MLKYFKQIIHRRKKGDDTMSAVAQNCAYVVKVSGRSVAKNKKEAVVSQEQIKRSKKVVDKYPLKSK